MSSHPSKIAPNFIVPDVVSTAKYYCDVLGFTSIRYDGDPPVFALVEWGAVPIMFKSYPGVNVALSNQRVHEDVGWDAYLWVTDARRVCEEIRVRGGDASRAKLRRLTTAAGSLKSKTSTAFCFALARNYRPIGRQSPASRCERAKVRIWCPDCCGPLVISLN